MKFKKSIFIDEKTLTKVEAEEFIEFLEDERLRHIKHMKEFKKQLDDDSYSDFQKIIAATVVSRDVDDVEHIDATLKLLSKKYNIKIEYCSFDC